MKRYTVFFLIGLGALVVLHFSLAATNNAPTSSFRGGFTSDATGTPSNTFSENNPSPTGTSPLFFPPSGGSNIINFDNYLGGDVGGQQRWTSVNDASGTVGVVQSSTIFGGVNALATYSYDGPSNAGNAQIQITPITTSDDVTGTIDFYSNDGYMVWAFSSSTTWTSQTGMIRLDDGHDDGVNVGPNGPNTLEILTSSTVWYAVDSYASSTEQQIEYEFKGTTEQYRIQLVGGANGWSPWEDYCISVCGGGTTVNYFTVSSDNTGHLEGWSDDLAINPLGPVSLSNLVQYKSDATMTLSEGSTTTETTLVFGANLQSSGTASETLQIEVKPAGTAFTNASSVSSVWVAPSSTVTVSWTPSAGPEAGSNGGYHWQARVLDKSGNTSTWQMYGSNASSTDFTINTIPLYTQETSTYPSSASTTWWAPQLLDNITTNTIANFGCLITSVVMDLRAYGITTTMAETYESSTGSSSADVNPANLNDWLEQDNSSGTGYSGGGLMNWMDIPYYVENSGTFPVWYNFGNDHISSVSSSWINKWLDYSSTATVPVILTEPIISGEQHYIVATGYAIHNNTSTYTIRDPFYYDNDYLNQSTTAHTHNYTNTYSSANILEPLNAPQLPLYLEYEIDSKHTLLITDSSGRRLGTDSQTGIDYKEIPNAGENNDQPGADFLAIYTPAAGKYTLTVGGSGPYQLESFVADGKHRPVPQVISSSTAALSAVTYHQNYDPTNIPSSTVQ